jgi:hypothetical protein
VGSWEIKQEEAVSLGKVGQALVLASNRALAREEAASLGKVRGALDPAADRADDLRKVTSTIF